MSKYAEISIKIKIGGERMSYLKRFAISVMATCLFSSADAFDRQAAVRYAEKYYG